MLWLLMRILHCNLVNTVRLLSVRLPALHYCIQVLLWYFLLQHMAACEKGDPSIASQDS